MMTCIAWGIEQKKFIQKLSEIHVYFRIHIKQIFKSYRDTPDL